VGVTEELITELERLRKAQRMSKSQLARLIGASRHTVGRKLSGETELSVGEAYAMCRALGTTLQEILDRVTECRRVDHPAPVA
jgi:transcriptional regulator with XRE-family HTH domain